MDTSDPDADDRVGMQAMIGKVDRAVYVYNEKKEISRALIGFQIFEKLP